MKFILIWLMLFRLNTPYMEFTEEDVRLLAEIMWLENGHTGLTAFDNIQCLILTGSVVINRAKNGGWGGSTIKAVLYAKGQYASETTSRIGKTTVPQYVIDLARDLLTYGSNVPNYVVYQSMQKKLGTHWKIIPNGSHPEYFATDGGHYLEGEDVIIKIDKTGYLKRLFNNKIKESLTRGLWGLF